MARRYSHRPLFPNPVVSFFLFWLGYILNGSTLPPSVTFCTARYALWPERADARSIQPLASRLAPNLVAHCCNDAGGKAFHASPRGVTAVFDAAPGPRNHSPRNGFDTSATEMSGIAAPSVYRGAVPWAPESGSWAYREIRANLEGWFCIQSGSSYVEW